MTFVPPPNPCPTCGRDNDLKVLVADNSHTWNAAIEAAAELVGDNDESFSHNGDLKTAIRLLKKDTPS